jgi:cytochrome c oxidase subunit 4
MDTDTATAHANSSARHYVVVWIYLLLVTALEVVLAYTHIFSVTMMLVILMVLSVGKAALIMAYFMHLRYERLSLILSIVPAGVVVISLLFAFFPDSFRLLELRVR